jgi:NarL family two-component system sensor histidine kinase LiaS
MSLDTELILEDLPCPSMSSQNASTLYRIGREAITNSLKHARASTIRVSIVDAYGGLQLTVSDDGIGMAPQRAKRSHFGIQTMRDRAEQDGGHLEFASDSVSGTKVSVWIPRMG